jgi:ubiquinone biosynthesis protein
MHIQPQLILLQKTLLNIEGLGRQLYPELDLWKTAQPVLRQWMRERTSPRMVLRGLRAHLPDALETLSLVPKIVKGIVREAADGRLRLPFESEGIAALKAEVERGAVSSEQLLLAAVLWLSGIVWLGLGAPHAWIGWAQLAAAAFTVGLAGWSRRRAARRGV